jgi:hypothetical protein
MKRALGYSIIRDPALALPQEADTYTCAHCAKVVDRVPFKGITDDDPRGRPIGGWCHKCDAPICIQCAMKGYCIPIEQWCEKIECKAHYDELLGRK